MVWVLVVAVLSHPHGWVSTDVLRSYHSLSACESAGRAEVEEMLREYSKAKFYCTPVRIEVKR